ncbi:MAG: tetratricopeptide repeat protein [Candidatus Electrothrix sp. GW3-4]|uniref:tetratricopeptide repeat protein n=1 Tax=Candidatus Electrothrix sp. GW3-4 TaxID=3126740 RepID=UPI0030CAAB09
MAIKDKLFGSPLDSFTTVTLALLLAITAVMLIQHGTAARQDEGVTVSAQEQAEEMYRKRLEQDKKIYKEVERLFGQRQYSAAQETLQKVQKEHPDNPRFFIYQARLYYNTGNMVGAISSYRQAVEREPDFVDNKTPLFIGDEIMDDLMAAKETFAQELKSRPKDKEMRKALDELLYLQRRVAGGCE